MNKERDHIDLADDRIYKVFFEACPVPLFVFDIPSMQIVDVNQRACDVYGYSTEEFLTMSTWDLRPPSEYSKVAEILQDISKDFSLVNQGTFIHKIKNGEFIKVNISTQVIQTEKGLKILALVNEVTREMRNHELDALEKEVIQLSLSDSTDLDSLLKKYLVGVEEIIPGIMISLLKLEEGKLYSYISVNIPEEVQNTIEGLAIGPEVAACGTAAYTKKLVIANDITKDPYWIHFRELAMKHHIASALSYPVFGGSGQVLMTFAVYRSKVWYPQQDEIDIYTRIGYLITLLLEKQEQSKLVNQALDRYHYVTKVTSDMIWDWDLRSNNVEWSGEYEKIYGSKDEFDGDRFTHWLNVIHPDDKDRILTALKNFQEQDKDKWDEEYRVKRPDGEYIFLKDSGYKIYDEQGKPYRVIGAVRDITAQRTKEILLVRQKYLLEKISAAFNGNEGLNETLISVMKILAEFGEFDAAETWLLGEGVLNLTAHISSNEKGDLFYADSTQINRVEFGEGFPGQTWKRKSMVVWKDISRSSQFKRHKAAANAGLENCVSLPLIYNGVVIGVLMLFGSKNTPLIEGFQSLLENMDSFIGTELKRKQAELELEMIFDTVPDIIVVTNKEGIITRINASGIKILEGEESEIIGRSIFSYTHPSDAMDARKKFSELREPGDFVYYEGRVISNKGNVRKLSCTFGYQPSENNMLGVCKDITRQSELQKLLDEASQLARIGGWEWDLTKDTFTLSPFTRSLLEIDDSFQTAPSTILSFCSDEFHEMLVERVNAAIRLGIPFDIELLARTQTGKDKWLRILCEIDRDNGVTRRIYGSVQDIHKRKITELQSAQRSNFLSSIATINSLILTGEDWFFSLFQAFEIAGLAVGVDRIHYFETSFHALTGEMVLNENFEWVKGQELSRRSNPNLQEIRLVERGPFLTDMMNGRSHVFSAEETDSQMGWLMKEQGIQYMLAIPMVASGKFLGFIGYEYFKKSRKWSSPEMAFLTSVTSNLATAIQRRENQHALNEVLEQRSEILESIGDAFFAVSRNWKISYWNKKAEEIFRLSKEKAMGNDLWELAPELNGSLLQDKLKQAMENMMTASVEYFSISVNKWFEVNMFPSVSGLSIYFKDISERRYSEEQLQRSNERFEKAAKATNDAIWDWDIENNTQYWGDGFTALFGFDTSEILHNRKIWLENIHEEDRQAVIDSIEEVLADEFEVNWHMEYRLNRSFGNYAYIDDRGVVIRNEAGKPIRMVGAITDITYQKEYERSLRKLNSNLERQTRELLSSNADLEQFAYVASHDLQEPLRMVSSFLTKLAQKYEGQLDEKGKQYIRFAVDGAQRMRQTILDLLQYSRIGKGNAQPEWIDMNVLMESVCALHKQTIDETNARIIWEKLPRIYSFQTPLLHVMNNLIGNALKYHRPSVEPEIRVRAAKYDDKWQFEVSDNGLGIENEYLQKIFVLFQRVHTQSNGSGIGLAVVRKIVESLQGKVWVESEPGAGSTFYFSIKEEKSGMESSNNPN